MDPALWECSYLYKVLMLKKIKGSKINKSQERFEENSYWEIKNDYDNLYSDTENNN